MTHSFRSVRFFLVVTFASHAAAQETRSVIHGRVLDPGNSSVVRASVMVTNTNTNVSTPVTTNETGYYEANFLLPGTYQVSSESAGFKKSVRSGIILPVGTRVEITMTLEIGNVTETISVNEQAPLVDTSSATGSNLIMDSRSVTDLPMFNNSPLMLIKFAPGMQGPRHPRIQRAQRIGWIGYHGSHRRGRRQ